MANDFESMPYLVTVTKVRQNRLLVLINEGEAHQVLPQEILRLHPIAVEIVRAPTGDDILPLTKPVVGTSGRVYTELPLPKGTPVTISTIGYNLYICFVQPPPLR